MNDRPSLRRTRAAARQRGNTLYGFIGGLVAGLTLAVIVAVYITNAPIPFVNKVTRATETINPGANGQLPDPNKPLYGTTAINPTGAPNTGGATSSAAAPKVADADAATSSKNDARVPLATESKAGAKTDVEAPTRYLLQAGAFKGPDEAESMRARLAMLGLDAKIIPRGQDGAPAFRVRLGPYGQIEEINKIRKTLAENGIDAQVVRLN